MVDWKYYYLSNNKSKGAIGENLKRG